ncbi:MAG: ParA family protein [Bacteroidota bacterium]
MPILSLAIQKGGSGKTTSAINLAAALQQMGKRVLLVDLDPQANLTEAMGVREEVNPSIYHLLKQQAFGNAPPLEDIIRPCGALSLVPASLDLANAEFELVSVFGRESLLKQLLEGKAATYDWVLIDCPPSVGMLTVNALTASDSVLMPLTAEYLPMQGVKSFLRMFHMVQKQLNPKINLMGLVLTRFDARKNLHQEIRGLLAEKYGDLLLPVHIRTNVALAQAQRAGVDIFQFDRTCNGALDYMYLAQEVLKRNT